MNDDRLLAFFEQDLQGDAKHCEMILTGVRKAISEKIDWKYTGNAMTVIVANQIVQLENEWTDPPEVVCMKSEYFLNELEKYQKRVTKR